MLFRNWKPSLRMHHLFPKKPPQRKRLMYGNCKKFLPSSCYPFNYTVHPYVYDLTYRHRMNFIGIVWLARVSGQKNTTVELFLSVPPPKVGNRSFHLRVVSLTTRSLTSYAVSPRSETSATHVYASFSQPWYKKVLYACVYFVLSATDRAKAVRELTDLARKRNDCRS